MTKNLGYVTVGLRNRGVSTRLRLRWDRSPRTCSEVTKILPIEGQIWHAKYANNEVYTLVPMFGEDPRGEWRCLYPGPGDLMYLPIESGFFLPPGAPDMDVTRGLVDFAYFYERGNNLAGPSGTALGNIFATGTDFDELERMAAACSDVWFSGAVDETLYIEAA
ncbi:MAG: DUF3830 family protein [Gammaproteobacteria bacterium]|nr:DUF3830 family protein [Gammaproteobacteria bacterium]MDH3469370.1 DUF3830 family protein [Gammaproteobacteria bacterium]